MSIIVVWVVTPWLSEFQMNGSALKVEAIRSSETSVTACSMLRTTTVTSYSYIFITFQAPVCGAGTITSGTSHLFTKW
jgi:hypothetical protein